MNEESAPVQISVSKRFEATAQEKVQWARQCLESGLSIRKFSALHSLPRQSLWRWVIKERQSQRQLAEGSSGSVQTEFMEIKLPKAAEPSSWVAELSLARGIVLRLTSEVPPAMLEQLLRLC